MMQDNLQTNRPQLGEIANRQPPHAYNSSTIMEFCHHQDNILAPPGRNKAVGKIHPQKKHMNGHWAYQKPVGLLSLPATSFINRTKKAHFLMSAGRERPVAGLCRGRSRILGLGWQLR